MQPDELNFNSACIMVCDVSGFVRKANDYLQAHGPKVGAEKTRIWLDSVFEVLLSTVDECEGEVLQFIGDAVVLRFPLEKAANAARCALLIKARCMQIQVQIKTGIAAGTYELYSHHKPNQQALNTLLGPAVQGALQSLQQAEHSDVICEESFLKHCQHPSGEFAAELLKSGFYKLAAQVHSAYKAGAIALPLAHDLDALNEIKLLTIVYVEVKLPAARRMLSKWLDELCTALEPLAQGHQATLIGLCQTANGYRFQYIMGSSKSEFNDVELAIQLATQLKAEIERHQGEHRVAIGYGHAWQGKLGGQTLKLFNAHGREINLAARILERAEFGQIDLTESAALQLNDQLHVVEQGELTIKGEDNPIRTYRVPLQHELENQAQRINNTLYGRAHELDNVLSILSAKEPNTPPPLIQITGEAGIGKSTFVGGIEQALQQRGITILKLRSSPHSSLLPYSIAYPFLIELGKLYACESLESWLIETLRPHAELADQLGVLSLISPLDLPGKEEAQHTSPESKSLAINSLFKALLLHASKEFKLCCVVEDLQWFDNSSVHLVTECLLKTPQIPCIYTIRTSESNTKTKQLLGQLKSAQARISEFDLRPFSWAETEQFVLNSFSVAEVPKPLVDALHQLSAGNLLLISSLVQSLQQDGTIRKLVLGGIQVDFKKLEQFSSLPINMEHALQARMDTLPKSHRIVLSHCSIFKTAFSASEVQDAFHYADRRWLDQVFMELENQKFVRSFMSNSGQIRLIFEHQVIEQCVYERIPFEERKALHAKFAQWLENQMTDTDLDDRNRLTIRLAAQYDWAGMLDKALPLTQNAIRFAFEVGALDDALERLDKLIEWNQSGVLGKLSNLDLAHLHEKKAQVYYSQGRLMDATHHYVLSLSTLGVKLDANAPLLKLRNYLTLQTIYLRGLLPSQLLPPRKPSTPQANLIVRLCTNLGELGFFMGKTQEGNLNLLYAVNTAEKFDLISGDEATAYSGCVILCQIYNIKRWMKFFKSRLYYSMSKLPEGHEKLKASAHINHRIGYVEYAAGRFQQAFDLIQKSVTAARLSQEFHTEVMSYSVLVFIRVAEGRFAEALAINDAYEALAKKYASKYFHVFHQYALINQRIYCLAMEKRLDEARTDLHFLEKIAKEFNFPHHSRVPMERCKLMVLYQEGDWSAARAQAMHLASLLTEEVLNKAYFFTCYSLPIEVLLQAASQQSPLTQDETETVELLFKQLHRSQACFGLARPIYLILEAQWRLLRGRSASKAKRQLLEALEMASTAGQQLEIKKAKKLLAACV